MSLNGPLQVIDSHHKPVTLLTALNRMCYRSIWDLRGPVFQVLRRHYDPSALRGPRPTGPRLYRLEPDARVAVHQGWEGRTVSTPSPVMSEGCQTIGNPYGPMGGFLLAL